FVFYFAAVSAITPPVALAAFAAAGIAGSEPMKTGMTAVRLGIAAFIVPYIFVYGESLLLIGSVPEIILTVMTEMIGIAGVAGAAVGWVLRHTFYYERVLIVIDSLSMIAPGLLTDVIVLIILVGN